MIYNSHSRCRQYPLPRAESNEELRNETLTAASETTHFLNASNVDRRYENRAKLCNTFITDGMGNL